MPRIASFCGFHLLVGLLLVVTGMAVADSDLTTYTDELHQISVSHPADWTTMTREALREKMPNFPLGNIVIFLFDEQDSSSNVNIQLSQISREPSSKEEISSILPEMEKELRKQRGQEYFAAVSSRVSRIAQYDAADFTFDSSYNGTRLRQRILSIAHNKRICTITCTSRKERFDADSSHCFEPLLRSLKIGDGGLAANSVSSPSDANWFSQLPPVARNAIIGACIGLAFSLFSATRVRKTPGPSPCKPELVKALQENMQDKSTDELRQLLEQHDGERWSEETFAAARLILASREAPAGAADEPKPSGENSRHAETEDK